MSGDHSHAAMNGPENEKRLKIAFAMTSTFLIIEVIGGVMTQSLALLSDAAHMATDAMALLIAIIAIRIGQRAADGKRSFGYRRFEILAAMLNAVILFLVAIYIFYEAVQRFSNPPEIQSIGMFVVATAGLIINLISMRMLTDASEHSLNVKGAYLEVMADMVGSIGVIVAALVIYFTGWWQIDPILAVLISFWILPRTWKLLSESINILLEGTPQDVEMVKLLDELKSIPGVSEVHDVHVWSITNGQNNLTAHLVVKDLTKAQDVMKAADAIAQKHKIDHSNLQVEPEGTYGEDHTSSGH